MFTTGPKGGAFAYPAPPLATPMESMDMFLELYIAVTVYLVGVRPVYNHGSGAIANITVIKRRAKSCRRSVCDSGI